MFNFIPCQRPWAFDANESLEGTLKIHIFFSPNPSLDPNCDLGIGFINDSNKLIHDEDNLFYQGDLFR